MAKAKQMPECARFLFGLDIPCISKCLGYYVTGFKRFTVFFETQ